MLSKIDREHVMEAVGNAVDGAVRENYRIKEGRKLTQEPRITERLSERVQKQLDGKKVGRYKLRVTAETLSDRGGNSAESLLGADLALSISLDGVDGFDKTLFIQAKYDVEADRNELIAACTKMEKIAGKKGSYIWIYCPHGVKVISSHQVRKMRGNDFESIAHRSVGGFTGRILDCHAGSKRIGIPRGVPDRRIYMQDKLEEWRAKAALDIQIIKA